MTLALKYRPTQFQDLVGQRSVSQTLSYALDQKKVSNAYLFSGLRGSGKTSSARIFARALQCENGPTSTPCETCDNCKSSLEGRHIDIIELDAASNRKIDDIRDLIEQTKYKPSFGRYKIFIIDEVHMLTKEAFNALLKTLEEPPEFVKFILATTDPLLLPATILSRTQHFRFKKIPHKSVVEHIALILKKENVPFEAEALDIIARSGSGSLRDTITILEQAIIFGNNQINVQSVTEMLGIIDPQIFEQFFDAILQKDLSLSQNILEIMQEYEAEMIIDEMMLFLKNKALQKNLNPTFLNRLFNILAQSKTLLSLNTDGEFVLMLLMLKMQEAMKLKDIHSLIREFENHSQVSLTQAPQVSLNHLQTPSSIPIADSKPLLKEVPTQTLFQKLIDALYDRNHHLGECFEKSIGFLSFEEKTLTLTNPSSNEEEKNFLREQYPLIKSFIAQIFGQETQIIFQHPQNTQESHQTQNNPIPTNEQSYKSDPIQANNQIPKEDPTQNPQDHQFHNTQFQTPQHQETTNPESINPEHINPKKPNQNISDLEVFNPEVLNQKDLDPKNPQQSINQNPFDQKTPHLETPVTQIPQDIPQSLETSHHTAESQPNQETHTPTTSQESTPSPQNFALKHQKLLSNLKKHLQADLSTAKKI